MPTITHMEKVVVAFAGSNAYLIPEVLKEKFNNLNRKELDIVFADYLYKRGEFDLYVEAKGIYSKYNTENALK